MILGLALGALGACSSTSGSDGGSCVSSCTQNSDCPRIMCTCEFDGGTVNFDGFCTDSCCGAARPAAVESLWAVNDAEICETPAA